MRVISQEELAQHGGVHMAVHGLVYDVSKFMNEHPGGRSSHLIIFYPISFHFE